MLRLKLLRDLRTSRWQYAALVLLLTLGVTSFGAFYAGYQNLWGSELRTYEKLRMADLTVRLARAPAEVVAAVSALPGVEAAEGRLSLDVGMRKPDSPDEVVSARVISVPAGRRPVVNDLLVRRGSYLSEGATAEALVNLDFADVYGLEPGDRILPIVDGKEVALVVAGVVTSAEYIWPAKSRQELLVPPGSFAVLFVSQEWVGSLFGLERAVNEIAILAEEDADQTALARTVEEALAPYGVLAVTPREDQPSYALLKMDLDGFRDIAIFVPVLFLMVTAMVTYVLLTRMVHAQRPQIGLMRAMGYSRRQVLLHYLSFALVIAVVGSVLGTVVGYLLSARLTQVYADLLSIPFVAVAPQWGVIVAGVLLAFVFCGVAGVLPAWGATRLAPAEAMRTAPPVAGRTLLVERLLPFLARLGYFWKIPLRNVFRRRRRTLYTALGTAAAVALTFSSLGMFDAMDHTMSLLWGRIQTYDLKVSFSQPQSAAVVERAAALPGVARAEPIMEVPVRLRHAGDAYDTALVGLSPGGVLYRLLWAAGAEPLSQDGLYVGAGVADVLGAEVGDDLELETAAGSMNAPVAGLVKSPLGSMVYVSLAEAQRRVGVPTVITGVMLKAETGRVEELKGKLRLLPPAVAVEELAETRRSLDEVMAFMYEFVGIIILFGMALAFGVVFNTVTINVLERAREMATMRTLGLSRRRVGLMLTVENLLVGAGGILVGLGLGYLLLLQLMGMFESDLFNFEIAVHPRTYAISIVGVLVVLLLSQVPAIRHVNRLDLARETKIQAT